MNMYPGEVYLVGGGVPLAIDNRLVGAVGVAGLPEGVDEKAALARHRRVEQIPREHEKIVSDCVSRKSA